MRGTLISGQGQAAWDAEPDLVAWKDRSRLDAARGMAEHMDEPRMQEALHRLLLNTEPAMANLNRLLAEASPVPLVIYHVPYRTGQPLSADAIRRLARIPGVIPR